MPRNCSSGCSDRPRTPCAHRTLNVLVYQGVSYTSRETVIDIGPVHATADREKTLPIPPVLGILAVAGGVALLVAGARKRN
jgi:hypothetical protein